MGQIRQCHGDAVLSRSSDHQYVLGDIEPAAIRTSAAVHPSCDLDRRHARRGGCSGHRGAQGPPPGAPELPGYLRLLVQHLRCHRLV